jgi:toxin YxiD
MRRSNFLAFTVLPLLLWQLACQQATPTAASISPSAALTAYPAHDLSIDEAAGGHTLRKHVGRTDQELQARLLQERTISAASTYTDRATAEKVVSMVLARDHERIGRWLERSGGHPNLVLDYQGDGAHPFGRTLPRGVNASQPCSHAVVVLRWSGGSEFYVLTTYPECR